MKKLAECHQDAEIAVVLGTIPLALPVEALSIRTNGEDKEVVAFVVPHEALTEALTLGEKMLETS